MVAKKKSKIVISQHTNVHMLHTQIYYSHTHTHNSRMPTCMCAR